MYINILFLSLCGLIDNTTNMNGNGITTFSYNCFTRIILHRNPIPEIEEMLGKERWRLQQDNDSNTSQFARAFLEENVPTVIKSEFQ